jgi:hypothetical protein
LAADQADFLHSQSREPGPVAPPHLTHPELVAIPQPETIPDSALEDFNHVTALGPAPCFDQDFQDREPILALGEEVAFLRRLRFIWFKFIPRGRILVMLQKAPDYILSGIVETLDKAQEPPKSVG